ncbi:MAG: extracellular solute-binding protein, partial [Okeania sp. SIO3B3]|nr:extracellular solute-binding protein [Okeania sp. SIO3B3]
MMKRVRVVLTLVLAICAVSGLWAGGQQEPESEKVVFWGFYDLTDTEDARAKFMAQAVEDFQTETGITVEYEQVSWDQLDNKIALLARSGGEMPDVVQAAAETIPGWIDSGALLDIKGSVESLAWYNTLDPFEREMFEMDGKRYAVGLFIG